MEHRDNGSLLAASVVGRQAIHASQRWSVAAARGPKMGQLAQAMQAYPSQAVGNQYIAWAAYLGGLNHPLAGSALRWLSR